MSKTFEFLNFGHWDYLRFGICYLEFIITNTPALHYSNIIMVDYS